MEYRKLSYAREGGFSLIEILVVLIIIGILAGISLNSIGRTIHYSDNNELDTISSFINSNIKHVLISGETVKISINKNKISATSHKNKIDEIKLKFFQIGRENKEINEINTEFSLIINQPNLLKTIELVAFSDTYSKKLYLSMNGLEAKNSD